MNFIAGTKYILPSALKGLVLGFAFIGVIVGAMFYSMHTSRESAISMGLMHSVALLPAGLVAELFYWLPLYVSLWLSRRNTYLTSCLIWIVPAATFWILDYGVLSAALTVQGIPVALLSHWFVKRDHGIPNLPANKPFNPDALKRAG